MIALDTSKTEWTQIGTILLYENVVGYCYIRGAVRAIVSRDPNMKHGVIVLRWHISVSKHDDYPSWDEIKDARYALIPDECYMAQILPPKSEYVNLHPNTFHLYEIPKD
jgi:hypothetical protein